MSQGKFNRVVFALACICFFCLAFYFISPIGTVEASETAAPIIQCQNLVYDYCRGFDTANLDLVMSIWTNDARVVWKSANWDYRGKQQIGENFSKGMQTWLNPRHVVTNWNWQVKGDVVEADCYWYWHANKKDQPTMVGEGSFHFGFVKKDGAWKVRYLEITPDWIKESPNWP